VKKILLFALLCVSTTSFALANPAAVNCIKKGFHYKLIGNKGICVFPDATYCEEWAYFRGQCQPGMYKLQHPHPFSRK
jgi:putative hemolysin